MNGVMSPGVSAGSSHVGASDTCTAHVICPSAPYACAPEPTTTRNPSRTATRRERWNRDFKGSVLLRVDVLETTSAPDGPGRSRSRTRRFGLSVCSIPEAGRADPARLRHVDHDVVRAVV